MDILESHIGKVKVDMVYWLHKNWWKFPDVCFSIFLSGWDFGLKVTQELFLALCSEVTLQCL